MAPPDGVLDLAEHEIERNVCLTAEQADALAASAARLEVRPTARVGHYDIKAGNVVGVIVTPGLRVFVRPKVPVRRLFYLLTYATQGLALQEMADFDEDVDLLEAVTHHFVRLLRPALARGLVRDYAVQTDDLHAMRGRMNLMVISVNYFCR